MTTRSIMAEANWALPGETQVHPQIADREREKKSAYCWPRVVIVDTKCSGSSYAWVVGRVVLHKAQVTFHSYKNKIDLYFTDGK